MIIWLNGGFRAGKTTLAGELHRRVPDAVVYDPEDVGLMLWKWIRPNDDFQDLPSWRELVVATALSLRRHHADTLIVPMSLIRDDYRAEILGGLADAGEEVPRVPAPVAPTVPGGQPSPASVPTRLVLAALEPSAQVPRPGSLIAWRTGAVAAGNHGSSDVASDPAS